MERPRKTLFRILYVHDPSNKAHRYRMSGILRYVSEHRDLVATGLSMLMPAHAPTQSLKEDFAAEIRRKIAESAPDGIISTRSISFPPGTNERAAVPTILPTVADVPEFFDCPADAFGILDDEAICRAAVHLALRRGHVHFAYVDSPLQSQWIRSTLRFEHNRRLLAEAGYGIERYTPVPADNEYAKLQDLASWLKGITKPCMVFAYADTCAHLVIDACHLAHLKVPDQVNVIGVDNDNEICETVRPTLTSVHPDFELGGYLAAKVLHEILLTGTRPETPIRFHFGIKALVERGSTQDLRGGGRLVTRAQKVIADQFASPQLTPARVAKRMNVSRQLLDLRFREIVGHTVHAEIERLRLEKARELLRTSEKSIGEIQLSCGYANADTFRCAFTAATGLTPRAWRS